MLTHDRLKALFHYNEATGIFTRDGKPVGMNNGNGYLRLRADGGLYYAHRLAWFYMTGAWPEFEIDHKNGDAPDNRFENLRSARRKQNGSNVRRKRSNTSGYPGVSFDKRKKKWRAYVSPNRRQVFLGHHDTVEAAAEAARVGRVRAFGEFARRAVVIVASIVFLTVTATAHDAGPGSWINNGGLRNSAGELCCGDNDCFVTPATPVTLPAPGYRLPSGEFIPEAEAQPSQDGQYWRCKRPDGSRRCFFFPPPTW